MNKPKITDTLSAYTLQRQIMEAALDEPGLQYRMKTDGAAVSFIQRCNKLRSNLRKQRENMYEGVIGAIAESPFDTLIIRRYGNVVQFDHNVLQGGLYDSDGHPITLDPVQRQKSSVASLDDAVAEAAANLNLNLDIIPDIITPSKDETDAK